MFARNLPGIEGEVLGVGRPRSFFELKDKKFSRFGETLRRILSQGRQLGASSLVLETLPQEGELAVESEDLSRRLGCAPTTQVWRLSFFTGIPKYPNTASEGGDFLGYAILRQDEWEDGFRAVVYESVMKRVALGHNYTRGEPVWNVRCGDDPFQVIGHLYVEQNDLTNVCAHASLRVVCAPHVADGLSYSKINQCLGITHQGESVVGKLRPEEKSKGLKLNDMERVLTEACRTQTFSHYFGPPELQDPIGGANAGTPPHSYQRSLYTCLESGYPALLVFGSIETLPAPDKPAGFKPDKSLFHVIPVFGHTFNQDMWVPRAEFTWFGGSGTGCLHSDLWLSDFIVHDDQLGSNYCIPKHYQPPLRLDRDPQKHPAKGQGVMAVVQPWPPGVQRDPANAEAQALLALARVMRNHAALVYSHLEHNTPRRWFHHLVGERNEGRLVLRPILVTKQRYLEHLRRLRGWAHVSNQKEVIGSDYLQAIQDLRIPDNEQLWMVEFSVLELFPTNLRKLGEVLVTATNRAIVLDDLSALHAIRLPAVALIPRQAAWKECCWRLVATGIDSHAQVFGTEDRDEDAPDSAA